MSEDGPRYVVTPPCPDCGQHEVVPIRYGFPTVEACREAEQGSLVLGGCVITGRDPNWACKVCGRAFRVTRGPK